MNTQLVPAAPVLPALVAQAREYMAASRAENTARAHRSDWRDFAAWCADGNRQALPAAPETVALYLADRAEACRPATLRRRLASIAVAHRAAGLESPTSAAPVRAVFRGICRTHGTAPDAKAPVRVEELRRLVETCGTDLRGVRDRALLLVGFAGAFRRAELVALDRDDVALVPDGLTISLRRSKTDQEGEGRLVGIPYGSRRETCPVRAFLAWVEAAGIGAGPLFRSVNRHGQVLGRLTGQSVALVVKARCAAVGIDPAPFSGHSLRAGLATSAAAAGMSERSIMNQTGHRSVQMVRRYIREASVFRENAAAGVGL